MNNKLTSLSAMLGAAFVASAALSPLASAADASFTATTMEAGYTLADNTEGKCGEAKCGADKKTGEHSCGADHKKADQKKAESEGKCGEGKCGADMEDGDEKDSVE